MKTILNNIGVLYNEFGIRGNTPVVFIHGFPFNNTMWNPQIKRLPKNLYGITYDVRGHGSSGVGDGQYSLELFIDDLVALLDYLSLQKAVLCGLSMGGYIALRTVEKHPDRIQGLILCDTKSESDSDDAKVKRSATIKTVKTLGVQRFSESFVKSVVCENTFIRHPETVEFVHKIICENSPLGICGTLLALASRTDTTHVLSSIHVPTCIMTGEYDILTPPAVAKSMHKAIKDSELHIIPDAGHMSNLENTKSFNETLFSFLQKHW